MISARGLTKHYGRTVAVRDLTFTVRPGVVTGFLGPNGAGKSTTMRMLIGLDRPTPARPRLTGSRSGSCGRRLALGAEAADNRRVLAALRYIGA